MKFDDERLLVQKAAFLRDLPSENEHGNFCEKASFECTDCLFTGCLFPGCLFIGCRVHVPQLSVCMMVASCTGSRIMCSLLREGADSAAVVVADGRAGGDADGREHDNLKCPPSNSTISSGDCELRR